MRQLARHWGDPAKAAAAVLHISSLSDPPLRLLLGRDACNADEKHGLDMLASARKWKDLSVSTGYVPIGNEAEEYRVSEEQK